MSYNNEIENLKVQLGQELIDKIIEGSVINDFPEKTDLIREGQYIKVIPIVLKGLIEVFIRKDDKELLLYYIKPGESCIMTFLACFKNEKSKIFAITEEKTSAILIPADKLLQWLYEYPGLNKLFYQQFDLRYTELIDAIHHLIYDRLDKRLLDYLREKSSITGKNPIKISHKEIAHDLGTAREVVSRIIKKLESQKKLKHLHDNIEIF
jgi:CRP/FNR family transcriptional regulator